MGFCLSDGLDAKLSEARYFRDTIELCRSSAFVSTREPCRWRRTGGKKVKVRTMTLPPRIAIRVRSESVVRLGVRIGTHRRKARQ